MMIRYMTHNNKNNSKIFIDYGEEEDFDVNDPDLFK